MGSIRAQSQFIRSRWRLRLLLPMWILQLGLSLVMTGLFAWRLGSSIRHFTTRRSEEGVPILEFIWLGCNSILSFVASGCTIVEIARYIDESLTPWTVLFSHSIKVACAATILALDVVAHFQKVDRHFTITGMALDGVFLFAALALVIHAIIAYRRLTIRYSHHPYSSDIPGYGFGDESGQETGYESRRRASDNRLSLPLVSPRLSFGSAISRRGEEQPDDASMEPVDRRISVYSHERDTQFDDYRARRTSMDTKSDVERAMITEFGWGSRSPGDSPPPDGEAVVSMGAVKVRTRGASAPRAPSWASDHALLAVPEEEDVGAAGKRADRKRKRQGSEAKPTDALLGGDGGRDSNEVDDENAGQRSSLGPRIPQETDLTESRWREVS